MNLLITPLDKRKVIIYHINMNKKSQIIKEWAKTKVVHPSYGEIAKIVGVSKAYVYEVIQKHLKK